MRFSELGTPLLAAATHAEVKDSKRVKSANRPFSLRDCVVPLFAINCVLDTPGFFLVTTQDTREEPLMIGDLSFPLTARYTLPLSILLIFEGFAARLFKF